MRDATDGTAPAHSSSVTHPQTVFPPPGWLTNRQTAARLGVGLETLTTNWRWRDAVKAAGRTVRMPGGGRTRIYPVEAIERIAAEREAAARAVVPDGFVDGDRAAEILGIARGTWNGWLSAGKIRIEHTQMPGTGNNGRRMVYAVADVQRVREELLATGALLVGADELGKGKWLTLIEAAALAGVAVKTWELWAKSGRVPAGAWAKAPSGRPCQMWQEKVALKAQTPRAGDGEWITSEEVVALLGTTPKTWRQAVCDGTAPAGIEGKSASGNFALLWRAEEIRKLKAERDATRAMPFPPAGWVDRERAAEHLNIGTATLNLWARKGLLDYEGVLAMGPNGVECRIYNLAELEQSHQRMMAADAEPVVLPPGTVDRETAAAFFGIATLTLDQWDRAKQFKGGRWLKLRRGKKQRVFRLAGLERYKAQRLAEAQRPVAPEGFIELHEAARMLAVSAHTIYQWEKRGRLVAGRVTPIPGTSARTKIYPLRDIEHMQEQIRDAAANFPPPGWVEMKQAARMAKVSVQVWKNWCQNGRVEDWKWASRPTMARCKLFSVEEIERLVKEAGRDHEFFLEPDGHGGWCPPAGYVFRDGAAAMFGVATGTFVHWQSQGRIACGRWARVPFESATLGANGRRVYPADEISRLVGEFSKVGKPYIDRNDPSIARVPIMSWSRTRSDAIIDAADLPLIEGMRFNLMDARPDEGAEAVVVRSGPSGQQTHLRRIVMGLWGIEHRYSHRNGDALDCRRANIVVKTHGEQVHGGRKRRTTQGGKPPTSRFKGVCWVDGGWKAGIQKDKQAYNLGKFEDEIAAAQAYDEKALELYDDRARLNFPDGVDAWLSDEAERSREDDDASDERPDQRAASAIAA